MTTVTQVDRGSGDGKTAHPPHSQRVEAVTSVRAN